MDNQASPSYPEGMARPQDEKRREVILKVSKRLFAEKGYASATISDIVRESGYPVGSIYTYFENKEAIIRSIIEDGWHDFSLELNADLVAEQSGKKRLDLLISRFLLRLLDDGEFVSILLTEGLQYVQVQSKMDVLSGMISEAVVDAEKHGRGTYLDFTPKALDAGLMIFFLGALEASRVSRKLGLGMTNADIVDFLRQLVHSSFPES